LRYGTQSKGSDGNRPIEYGHTGDMQNLSIDKNRFILTIIVSTKKAASHPWGCGFWIADSLPEWQGSVSVLCAVSGGVI